jgi:hypothetical protein
MSVAHLNIHLHCLVLDGVYHPTEGLPVFHAVRAPTATGVPALLNGIIKRIMNRMHRAPAQWCRFRPPPSRQRPCASLSDGLPEPLRPSFFMALLFVKLTGIETVWSFFFTNKYWTL